MSFAQDIGISSQILNSCFLWPVTLPSSSLPFPFLLLSTSSPSSPSSSLPLLPSSLSLFRGVVDSSRFLCRVPIVRPWMAILAALGVWVLVIFLFVLVLISN